MAAEQAETITARADATARAVIECAADAIVAFGPDRTVMLWNPAAERMFGWTAAEVVGLEPHIIPEELKAEHNAVLERVREGGHISFATRRIHKDSTVIDVRIDTSALVDGVGEVTGWVNVCRDQDGRDVPYSGRWTHTSVIRILTNPRIAGLNMLPNSDESIGEGNWAPIITPETWAAVKDILADPRRAAEKKKK